MAASAEAQPGQHDLVTQVLLRVHASNLPRYGILKSLPDVYAVVSSVMIKGSKNGPVPEEHDNGLFLAPTGQKDSHGQEIMEWGRTEM
jgi:hypothetical protein